MTKVYVKMNSRLKTLRRERDQMIRRKNRSALIMIFLPLILPMLMLMHGIYANLTRDSVTLKVNRLERITESNSSRYLIFGEGETLQNSDSLWYWKWNSSDIYGELKEGQTYKFQVYGWRIPFFSVYRNVIEYETP